MEQQCIIVGFGMPVALNFCTFEIESKCSSIATISPESNYESCTASPRAAVYVPAIANATQKTPSCKQFLSSQPAGSYYIFNDVLLSTAIVLVRHGSGEFIQCRAQLGSRPQLCLVARRCGNTLRLPDRSTHLHILGRAGAKMHAI